MHFFTLGYSDNPLIAEYRWLFLRRLEHLWDFHLWAHPVSADFLLFPDVHSNLLALTHQPDEAQRLHSEIMLQYHSYNTNGWVFPQQNLIRDTQIDLTMEYSNPYISTDSHPDHIRDGIMITFWEKLPNEWNDLFSRVFLILKQVSPWFFAEVNWLLRKILPFGLTYGTHNSWSYSNAIWHITMSYPLAIDSPEIVLLEALIHEYNHNKINLILQSEILLRDDFRELYYSPYRPDPRSIHGIYLWLHALVWAYWVIWKAYQDGHIVLQESDIKKWLLYVLKNSASIQMIEKYAHLTALWVQFFSDMKAIHRETLTFIKACSLSREHIEASRDETARHYADVCSRHPKILW